MLNFFLHFVSSSIVLTLIVSLVPNVKVESRFNFALSLLAMTFLNFLIRPMLLILRGDIRTGELAIMSVILNLLILNLSSGLIDDFDYSALSSALFGATLMAVSQALIDKYETSQGKVIS